MLFFDRTKLNSGVNEFEKNVLKSQGKPYTTRLNFGTWHVAKCKHTRFCALTFLHLFICLIQLFRNSFCKSCARFLSLYLHLSNQTYKVPGQVDTIIDHNESVQNRFLSKLIFGSGKLRKDSHVSGLTT